MIIDSHAHLGTCRVFDVTVTADDLLGTMDANGIDASIVFPLPGDPDCPGRHDEIAALSRQQPGRIIGLASLNPHMDDDAYFAEVRRCVRDLGFVGLKLHPAGHACSPMAKDALKVFETARALRVPLIIHTGIGAPWALPSLVIPRAQQFPDVKIVLAHSGAYIYTAEALVAAMVCPNIYLETSWCGPHRIRELAETLGPGRVMFGADLPSNVATELTKYRTNGLSQEALEPCLSKAAQEVFGL